MGKPFVAETADELVYIAESDIMAFKELLAGIYYPADRKCNIICFHATMAVEKFLKGYVISNGKRIGPKHDLNYLCKSATAIDSSFNRIAMHTTLLITFVPKLKYSSKIPITKQDIDKITLSLEAICDFPPIKTMRDSFGEKHKYEIVTSIMTNPAKNSKRVNRIKRGNHH
jgi:hypothetical protein